MEPERVGLIESLAGRRRDNGRRRQVLTTFVVDLQAFVFGMTMGWSSSALPLLLSEDSLLTTGPITKEDASWLASVLCIVAIFTTPIYHYICEYYGRKACGFASVIPAIVSTFILIIGDTKAHLYLCRIIMGASAGATFIFCPIYVAEITEDAIRGALGVVIMLMRNSGILFAYVIGSYLPYKQVSWFSFIPTIICLFSMFALPETPVYLLRRKRNAEAIESLKFFRGDHVNISLEIERLRVLVEKDSSTNDSPSIRDIFVDKTARRSLFIAFVLYCNQQLCGFYGIISYAVTIFKEAGTDWSPETCTIIIGVMLVFGTIVSVFLCETAGRKFLLVFSNGLLAIMLAILATYFYLKEQGWTLEAFHWIPVFCLSIYVIGLNIGLASLPVLVSTEIFSPKFTSLAITITSPSTWLLTFLIAKYFPAVSESIGIHGSYTIFGVVCLLGAIFTWVYVPETKNKPLHSILEEIDSKVSFNLCARRTPNSEQYPLLEVQHQR